MYYLRVLEVTSLTAVITLGSLGPSPISRALAFLTPARSLPHKIPTTGLATRGTLEGKATAHSSQPPHPHPYHREGDKDNRVELLNLKSADGRFPTPDPELPGDGTACASWRDPLCAKPQGLSPCLILPPRGVCGGLWC